MTKNGPSTLILTGANSYAGGTTINFGTLQLGNDGASGSIIGNVVNNGTLALDRSDTVTFGGMIAGSGGLNQIGSGTTVLTGANSYAGPTGPPSSDCPSETLSKALIAHLPLDAARNSHTLG